MLKEFFEFLLAEIVFPAVKKYLIRELADFLSQFSGQPYLESVWELILHLLGM